MVDERETETPRRELETTSPPGLAVNPQATSMLFVRLPAEIRNEIYSILFSSTRLTYGSRHPLRMNSSNIKPAPNALALIQTCRQAKEEIGDTWISQITLRFEDPETMLEKLTSLPPGAISNIRHLHILGYTLILSVPQGSVRFRLSKILKLLPGLCLDTITILSDRGTYFIYDTVTELLRDSCGWKELRYITRSSDVLGFAKSAYYQPVKKSEKYRYWRLPQPLYWQYVLKKRDGASSRPSVVMYRSRMSDSPGTVIDPKTRVYFRQKVPEGKEARKAFGIAEDKELMADGEKGKEIMIVARRGAGVDYEQKEGSPFTGIDIARHLLGKKWSQVRHECIDTFRREEDEVPAIHDDSEESITVDAYEDVDSYKWPPESPPTPSGPLFWG
ncbi:hypothetical protein B0J13DRAFT_638606 [Dactylonectria estremocensis]|uniref:F-box domain-containing protein n=1 Tax=Dactylonectria estremocensis TaxID=1079267 RepID=A0A9P9EL53_9HYPO|nr:hypothetical protein B0J13DRAFT_638606 [Dactylonectria estremocensis]